MGVSVGVSVAAGAEVGFIVAVGKIWVAVGEKTATIPGTNQKAFARVGSPPLTSTVSMKRTCLPAC